MVNVVVFTRYQNKSRRFQAGEEITDFYGQHFFLSTTEERQSRLGFECQCSPCLQNWGTYPILSTAGLEEEKESKLLKMQDSLTIASQSMDVEKIKAASLEICLFLATLPRPQKALIIPEMNVNICSGLMHGNKSVQFIERLFNISGQKK